MSQYYLAEMYLDWFNNFITVSAFADHYGLTDEDAQRVIDEGRTQHERRLFSDLISQ